MYVKLSSQTLRLNLSVTWAKRNKSLIRLSIWIRKRVSNFLNCQKLTKWPISQFAIFQKHAALKRIDLNQRSIFLHEIFGINVEVSHEITLLTGILIWVFRKIWWRNSGKSQAEKYKIRHLRPYLGIWFLAHNSAIFFQFQKEKYPRTQGTYSYK